MGVGVAVGMGVGSGVGEAVGTGAGVAVGVRVGVATGVGHSGQHLPRCHLRIGGVALSILESSGLDRPVDLDNGVASEGQEPGQSGSVGTGALDPKGVNFTELSGSPFQFPIPVTGRWGIAPSETHTLLVNGNGHVLVLVSIDSDDHPNSAYDFPVDDCCHFCLLKE